MTARSSWRLMKPLPSWNTFKKTDLLYSGKIGSLEVFKVKKTEEDFQGKPWILIATASCNQQALLHFVGFQKKGGSTDRREYTFLSVAPGIRPSQSFSF